jgi:DNA invertase Pin-like site-specific DNA recombinase
MKYGYARVSTDGQSVDAQVRQLTNAGCAKVFREVASGANDAGDVVTVMRLDRLARSTRDLLNTMATITSRKAGFRSLGDAWADTTTSHGRLMLAVIGGLAEFERDLIRSRTGEGRERAKGARREDGSQAEAYPASTRRGDQATRRRPSRARDRQNLRRASFDDFEAVRMTSTSNFRWTCSIYDAAKSPC